MYTNWHISVSLFLYTIKDNAYPLANRPPLNSDDQQTSLRDNLTIWLSACIFIIYADIVVVNIWNIVNKSDQFTNIIAAEMFPEITFARVQGKTDRYPGKPDPASLLDISEELQVSKEEVLYIGDADIAVLTAHKAGADHIVESPYDIVKLFKNNSVY